MEAKITYVDPNDFSLEVYSPSDENLISNVEISTVFNPGTDYIEYFIYNPNQGGLLLGVENFTGYSLLDNLLTISPEDNLREEGYDTGNYNTVYNFLSNRLSSSPSRNYFISEISSDRTEIRLLSNTISTPELITSTNEFIEERSIDNYYPDFYLNFGQNQLVIANNIQLDVDSVLIKLYEPLPQQFSTNSTLWVVEQVADSVAYYIELPNEIITVDNSIKLRGPNLNIPIKGQVNNSTEPVNYDDLTATSVTASLQQINSFYEDPSVQINVDYSDFENFINFSSAQKRLNNFFFKLQQIENYTSLASSGSNQYNAAGVSGSYLYYQKQVDEIITTFDNYEYYLYYTSGSTAWPKSNTSQPYIQCSTTSSLGQSWISASVVDAEYYDDNNSNWIYNAIPEYIREDELNQPYIDFCNMVGQFYDENIWVYVKDITNKWYNDNSIDLGISRDLVAQQLRDLGFNIYENQFSSFNLFSATLGITPSGSDFPFPYMTGSLPTPSGYEYVNEFITGSNEVLPQDDVNKRLYKRIYANLSYLYKKKGTIDGIRALATIYGIPDTLLRIDEFGGKDKDHTNDWDYWFQQFNYKFDTGVDGYVTSSWGVNYRYADGYDEVDYDTTGIYDAEGIISSGGRTLQFRFKTPGLQSGIDTPNQSLWNLDTGVYITLEYTGSGYQSGSFGGSTANPYNQYATLKLYPDYVADPSNSASIYLPFYDGGWWSVMATMENNTASLYAGNNIYSGDDGSKIGFTGSDSVVVATEDEWLSGSISYFAYPSIYPKFSGSLQEIRYFYPAISESVFEDYVMNPQSIEGNGLNSGSVELAFRAALGGELFTGSSSIHPKVTGSWATTQSFYSSSEFYYTGSFSPNVEYVYMDQPAAGIKNRISDKIKDVELNLPSGNTLSSKISIQQNPPATKAYTDSINLLEVAFSPSNQINDDINSSIGYFNMGEYIGDPRLNLTSSVIYPELDALNQEYFLKYKSNYDWNDFVRLIKFFDNSLFKVVKDFVPAKTSLAAGVVIKQHLLERNRYPQPPVSWSFHELTGSIGQTPYLLDDQRAYSASNAWESIPVEAITGSQGGTLPVFVPDTNYTALDYPGAINVTQSWSGANTTPFGYEAFTQDDAREFINGEFSGSAILVTNGELNTGCDPFKKESTVEVKYNIISLPYNQQGVSGTYNQRPFSFFLNPPSPIYGAQGDIVLWWNAAGGFPPETFDYAWEYQIEAVKIFKTSSNGLDNTIYLDDLKQINLSLNNWTVNFAGANTVAYAPSLVPFGEISLNVLNITEYNDFYLYYVEPAGQVILESDSLNPQAIDIQEQLGKLTVLSPYVPDTFFQGDCNAVYGNRLDARQSKIFWDLDYQSNAIQAVNQSAVITASQTPDPYFPKAFVQDYNWFANASVLPRYKGSRTTAPDFNLAALPNQGYGSSPVIQSEGIYFAYFNWVGGTSPEWGNNLADRTAANIRYYIDDQENVVEPINDSNGVNLSIVQQNFPQDSLAILSFNDKNNASAQFTNLVGTSSVFLSGEKIVPILYTQTASIGSNLLLDNAGGGYTGSIEFVDGDLPAGAVTQDYQLYAVLGTDIQGWDTLGKIQFPSVIKQDTTYSTWGTNDTYSPDTVNPSSTTPPVTLHFKAVLNFGTYSNPWWTFLPDWRGRVFIYKNGSPKASMDIHLPNGSASSWVVYWSDPSALTTDTYSVQLFVESGKPGDLLASSYFEVKQSPLPAEGECTLFWEYYPTPGTPSNQIRAVDDNPPTSYGLKNYYNKRQADIAGSGFNPLTLPFTVQVGDEIRFGGTETQAYYIKEVSSTGSATIPPTYGEIILTLDRLCNAGNLDYFLLRRYVDDPSYIYLDVDKPAGGTSAGILTPQYFYSGTDKKVNSILKSLKEKGLI